MLRKIFTEPLLHFIVIAMLFFVAYNTLNPKRFDDQVVVVSEGRVAQINSSFITSWNRAPSPAELEAAIQGFAVNEMYLREARALTLDVDDKVINRRLRQKMEFMLADMASGNEAGNEELRKFYADNPARYRSSPEYSFKQVFISSDRTESELQEYFLKQKKRIQQGLAPEGDNSLLPADVPLTAKAQLTGTFGETFVNSLQDLELQQWQGPVRSDFGFHFAFMRANKTAAIKPFESVRNSVLQDWQYQNNKSFQEQYEQRLSERYKVTVQMPESLTTQ